MSFGGGGGTDDNEVFSSLVNIILSKIQDEEERNEGEVYHFQSLYYTKENIEQQEDNETLFERINNLYRRALQQRMFLSPTEKDFVIDEKKFSLNKLKYAVQSLEKFSFVDGKNSINGKDILGDFFEGIIRNGFKQSKGQFFTHINIVTFILWALQLDKLAIERINNDNQIPYLIDPSAGSGTFLIEYMKFITQNIKYRFCDKINSNRALKASMLRWFPEYHENIWASDYIYGIEHNFNLGTSSKVNMILHGDGSTNIFVKDGLLPFSSYSKESSPNVLKSHESDKLYTDKNLYAKQVNKEFDAVISNPPFSVELDNDTKKSLIKSFQYGEKKNSENLFIERYYQLLKPKGRMGIVLPESVFDTTENKYIRLFLFKYFHIKAVVSLPQLTFEPYTSTKTSLLFAQKKTEEEIELWNNYWQQYSSEWQMLKTRITDYIKYFVDEQKLNKRWAEDVVNDIQTNNISNIKNNILRFLKDFVTEQDTQLDVKELLIKYCLEIENLTKYNNDTADTFGYVNTWWVFSEVAKQFPNEQIFMAQAENIGYKRTLRGEKQMPNDLYDINYAPDNLDFSLIYNKYNKQITQKQNALMEYNQNITAIEEKQTKTKKDSEALKRLKLSKESIEKHLQQLKNDLSTVKKIETTYYNNNILKDEYKERTDKTLISYFQNGIMKEYKDNQIALRDNELITILDHIRKEVVWQ